MAIAHLTKAEFSAKIANLDAAISEWRYLGSRPAIVDFYATWCGPCRALAPILEELAEEYAGEVDFYKVDIDREEELAAAFGVRSGPHAALHSRRGDASDSHRRTAQADAARGHRRAAAQAPRSPRLIPPPKRKRRGGTRMSAAPWHISRNLPLRTYT